ncbi:MAG: stage III sporulation protein AF [Lachnospiraceae bacterium]
MDIIYAWVKNIVCYYIFLTVIFHLLPKSSYQKYVRFFSGMLLMILVVTPVLSVLGKEDVLLQKINQAGFFQELDNLKLDTEHLQQTQKEVYLKEYEQAIGMDISRMAEEKQLETHQVTVHLSEEYFVESIYMTVRLTTEEGPSLQQVLYTDHKEYPEVYKLKQELMEFYQMEEEQIEILVQGG